MATWFFGLFGLASSGGHVHLCGSPLYHTAVLNFAAISIQLGHPVVLMDRWDPEESLRLIERHRVTHTHAVPTQFRRMLAAYRNSSARLAEASCSHIASASARVESPRHPDLGPGALDYLTGRRLPALALPATSGDPLRIDALGRPCPGRAPC